MLTDLKKLFQSRFAEISLIVAFQAFGLFFIISIIDSISIPQDPSGQIVSDLSDVALFVYSIASMVFLVLWAHLLLGFLATASIERDTPHAPVTLIRFGRRFFWRTFRFYLLFSIYAGVMYIVLFEIVRKFLLGGAKSGPEVMLVNSICQLVPMLLLVKLLLIPAIMIIYDCMVFPAMAYLRQMRIFKAKYVIFFTAIYVAFGIAMLLLSTQIDKEIGFYTVFKIFHTVISGLLLLLIGLSSIWYVNGGKFGDFQPANQEDEE